MIRLRETPSVMKAHCPHFGKCSGCTLQHFPYVKQLHDKQKAVQSFFAHLLRPSAGVALQPIQGSPSEFGYRISSKLCLHEDEFGRRSIGLYQQASKRVLHIADCPVHHPEINRLLARLFPFGASLPAPFYQHQRKGFQAARMKFLTLRYCPETRAFGLILSHTGIARSELESWASLHVQQRFPQLCLYEARLDAEDGDLVISREVNHLAGDKTFSFRTAGRTFSLSPLAFFQANGSLSPQFIDHITHDLAGEGLLDLYGGFGAYSFAAEERFRSVHLVEANPHALAAARDLATREEHARIKVHAATVEDFLRKGLAAASRSEITHIIVNPPRSGLSTQVRQALHKNLWASGQHLVYVSCEKATLRRDLLELIGQGGWTLETLTPFDMFPQTEHLELVAKLKVRSPAPGRQPGSPPRVKPEKTPATSRDQVKRFQKKAGAKKPQTR